MLSAFGGGLLTRFADSYRGYRWVWHVLAALSTLVLVASGFDWWFFEHTRIDTLYPLIMLAGLGGFLVPVLLPVALYWWGEWKGDEKLKRAGVAVAQAEIVAIVISSVYKAFTGRIQPEFLTHLSTADISHGFNFGFLQHGIFWGWPSSHAAVACAGMTVLFLFYKNRSARAVVLLYTLVISIGAAVGFHWFSDVAAGVIVGVSIGIAVQKNFSVY